MKKVMAVLVGVMFVASVGLASAEEVVVTGNGKKYHQPTCSLVKNKDVTKMDRADAEKQGLEPCSRCFKPASEKSVSEKEKPRIKKTDK